MGQSVRGQYIGFSVHDTVYRIKYTRYSVEDISSLYRTVKPPSGPPGPLPEVHPVDPLPGGAASLQGLAGLQANTALHCTDPNSVFYPFLGVTKGFVAFLDFLGEFQRCILKDMVRVVPMNYL